MADKGASRSPSRHSPMRTGGVLHMATERAIVEENEKVITQMPIKDAPSGPGGWYKGETCHGAGGSLLPQGHGKAVFDGKGPFREYDGGWKWGQRHGNGRMTIEGEGERVVEAEWTNGIPLICAFCGKAAGTGLPCFPCPKCSCARYCSEKCMTKDSRNHRMECESLALL